MAVLTEEEISKFENDLSLHFHVAGIQPVAAKDLVDTIRALQRDLNHWLGDRDELLRERNEARSAAANRYTPNAKAILKNLWHAIGLGDGPSFERALEMSGFSDVYAHVYSEVLIRSKGEALANAEARIVELEQQLAEAPFEITGDQLKDDMLWWSSTQECWHGKPKALGLRSKDRFLAKRKPQPTDQEKTVEEILRDHEYSPNYEACSCDGHHLGVDYPKHLEEVLRKAGKLIES